MRGPVGPCTLSSSRSVVIGSTDAAPQRGNDARQHRRAEQQRRDDGKRRRIDRAHAEQDAAHGAAHQVGADGAKGDATEARHQSLAKRICWSTLMAAGAERHAQANLVRPLGDRERHHTVDAERREHEGAMMANAPNSTA